MRALRAGLITLGVAATAYAAFGAFRDPDVRLGNVLAFLGVVLIAHDLVLLPGVLLAGAVITRWVPPIARTPVRCAGLAGLAVTLVAAPLVVGRGRVPDDPSVLPLPYGRGLAGTLVAIGLLTVAAIAVRARRKQSERSTMRDSPR